MTGPSSERTADAARDDAGERWKNWEVLVADASRVGDLIQTLGAHATVREINAQTLQDECDRLVARNQQLQEALANLERLVLMSVTELDHECRGKCPDEDMPDMRDPDCLACSALDIAAVRARTPR